MKKKMQGILVGKPEGKTAHGWLTYTWEGNVLKNRMGDWGVDSSG